MINDDSKSSSDSDKVAVEADFLAPPNLFRAQVKYGKVLNITIPGELGNLVSEAMNITSSHNRSPGATYMFPLSEDAVIEFRAKLDEAGRARLAQIENAISQITDSSPWQIVEEQGHLSQQYLNKPAVELPEGLGIEEV